MKLRVSARHGGESKHLPRPKKCGSHSEEDPDLRSGFSAFGVRFALPRPSASVRLGDRSAQAGGLSDR